MNIETTSRQLDALGNATRLRIYRTLVRAGDRGAPSYAGIWVTGPDQAARFAVSFAATPSVNVTPSMTKGN